MRLPLCMPNSEVCCVILPSLTADKARCLGRVKGHSDARNHDFKWVCPTDCDEPGYPKHIEGLHLSIDRTFPCGLCNVGEGCKALPKARQSIDPLIVLQLADIWDAAGHTVHPGACMQCWLLPCSISGTMEEQTPLVEEQKMLQAMNAAARVIQRCWRVRHLVQTIRQFARQHGVVLSSPGMHNSSFHPYLRQVFETVGCHVSTSVCFKSMLVACVHPVLSICNSSLYVCTLLAEHAGREQGGTSQTAWNQAGHAISSGVDVKQPTASIQIIDRLIRAKLDTSDRALFDSLASQHTCALSP
jgi:hypothetical protein